MTQLHEFYLHCVILGERRYYAYFNASLLSHIYVCEASTRKIFWYAWRTHTQMWGIRNCFESNGIRLLVISVAIIKPIWNNIKAIKLNRFGEISRTHTCSSPHISDVGIFTRRIKICETFFNDIAYSITINSSNRIREKSEIWLMQKREERFANNLSV